MFGGEKPILFAHLNSAVPGPVLILMLFPHFSHPQVGLNKESVNQVMAGLDMDGDAQLNFKEFMIMVVDLILMIHEAFGGSFTAAQCKS